MLKGRLRLILGLMAGLLVATPAPSHAQDGPMRFTAKTYDAMAGMLMPGAVFLYGKGEIDETTPARLREAVRRHQVPPGSWVYLSSPGGSLQAGLELGRTVRELGLFTSVGEREPETRGNAPARAAPPALCASACVFGFLGGHRRHISEPNRIGVHRFFFRDSDVATSAQATDRAQIISSRIVSYLREMGVQSDFFTEMTKAGAQELNILSLRRMAELNAITPHAETKWELVQDSTLARRGAPVYLRGTTDDERGTHKLVMVCNPEHGKQLEILWFLEAGEWGADIVALGSMIALTWKGGHVLLEADEILQFPKVSNRFVVLVTRISPRMELLLRTKPEVGIALMPPSQAIFWGWTSDIMQGRQMVTTFMDSCG